MPLQSPGGVQMRVVCLDLSKARWSTAISFPESGSMTRTEWSFKEAAIYLLTIIEWKEQIPILPIGESCDRKAFILRCRKPQCFWLDLLVTLRRGEYTLESMLFREILQLSLDEMWLDAYTVRGVGQIVTYLFCGIGSNQPNSWMLCALSTLGTSAHIYSITLARMWVE